MKYIIALLIVAAAVSPLRAGPLVDFIVGGVLVANGGVFEYQRTKAASDKEDALKKGQDKFTQSINLDESAWYYWGAADWERANFGVTANYNLLVQRGNNFYALALVAAAEAGRHGRDANDAQDKENLYKGVSLTSFGVGGIFIVKGAISLIVNRNKSAVSAKKYHWVKNFDLQPLQSMNGAHLAWSTRF